METLQIRGKYNFKILGIDGLVRDEWSVDNLVVTAGKAQLALLAGDASATPFTYLALGSSSTAVSAGQTALVSEIVASGLERAAATVSRTTTTVTNDTLSLAKTFTATGAVTVEEIGAFNASSAGTMLGRALTGTKTLATGEQIIATYTLAFA